MHRLSPWILSLGAKKIRSRRRRSRRRVESEGAISWEGAQASLPGMGRGNGAGLASAACKREGSPKRRLRSGGSMERGLPLARCAMPGLGLLLGALLLVDLICGSAAAPATALPNLSLDQREWPRKEWVRVQSHRIVSRLCQRPVAAEWVRAQ